MCFGETHSWTTFAIGTFFTLASLYYAIKKKLPYEYIVLILYWFSGVTMQLWEALIHHDYTYNNGKNCETYSKLAYYNNILQPVILGVLLKRPESLLLVFVYIMVILKNTAPEKCILYNGQIDLRWWDNSHNKVLTVGSYFVISILLLLLFKDKLSVILFILTYIGSILIYSNKRSGSIWCYFASFIPVVFFINLLFKKNNIS